MAETKKTTTKKPEVKNIIKEATEPKVDMTIKRRCDFKSWEDYNKYTGKKG